MPVDNAVELDAAVLPEAVGALAPKLLLKVGAKQEPVLELLEKKTRLEQLLM